MTALTTLRIGVMYDRAWAPEDLPTFARDVEDLGADDLWVVEDLGWGGGVAAAAVALGATSRLRVGIGIAPAPLRNPALLAMETAYLARVFPGRLVAGLGHGVAEWMESVGATAKSPLALLEESTSAVRALLHGERVELAGREVRIDGLQLVHPPTVVPPVVLGVVRPRSLEVAGRVADGTVIAEGQGPEQLRTSLESIREGGGRADHELIVFAFASVAEDAARAADVLSPALQGQAEWLGRTEDQLFTVCGTPADAVGRIRELEAAGATTVVLRFSGDEPARQLGSVLAALGRRAS